MAQFSVQQLKEFRDVFSSFDKDNDGYIAADDVGDAARTLGAILSQSQLSQLLHESGKSKDDRVDFEDFLTLMVRSVGNQPDSAELSKDFMTAFLRILDVDGTGIISTDSLRIKLTYVGKALTPDKVDKLLKDTDKDGKGLVNYMEFVQTMDF